MNISHKSQENAHMQWLKYLDITIVLRGIRYSKLEVAKRQVKYSTENKTKFNDTLLVQRIANHRLC
jgi:hypothetical protein